MIFIISLFCAFLFFFILFFLLGHALKKKQVVSERLQQYADYLDVKETEEERISTGQKLRLAFRKRMRRVGGRKTASKLDLMMHRAGLPLLGFEMVAISFGVSVLAFLIVLLVAGEGEHSVRSLHVDGRQEHLAYPRFSGTSESLRSILIKLFCIEMSMRIYYFEH